MYKRTIFSILISILFIPNILFAQSTNDITLKPGFNFVSFTNLITLTPTELKTLNTSIEDVFLYSSSAGSFLSASEGTLSSLSAGKGYIIKSNASSDIKISITGNAITTINPLNLKTGFNLIGFSQAPTAHTFVKLMTDNSIVNGCYKWSPTAGSFIQVIRNESGIISKIDGVDPTIKAGESYFFNLKNDAVLEITTNSILLNNGPPVVQELILSKSSDQIDPLTNYQLNTITVIVKMTDNTTKIVLPKWELVSGFGTVENNIFMAPYNFDKTILSATYYENDNSVKSFLTLTTNIKTLSYISTSITSDTLEIKSTYDLNKISAYANYTNESTKEITVTWVAKVGKVFNNVYTAPDYSIIDELSSSYTENGINKSTTIKLYIHQGGYIFIKQWGTLGTEDTNFNWPNALKINNGNVIVSDYRNNYVKTFDLLGNFTNKFSAQRSSSMYEDDLAVDKDGNVYMTDSGNYKIRVFDSQGNLIKTINTIINSTNIRVKFIAVDSAKNIYYPYTVYMSDGSITSIPTPSSTKQLKIRKLDNQGNFLTEWVVNESSTSYYGGIVVDKNDNIYIVESSEKLYLTKFNSSGTLIQKFYNDRFVLDQFEYVAIDQNSNFYLLTRGEPLQGRALVHKYDKDFNFVCEFASYGKNEGQFSYAWGLDIAPNNDVYVSDGGLNRIQVFRHINNF